MGRNGLIVALSALALVSAAAVAAPVFKSGVPPVALPVIVPVPLPSTLTSSTPPASVTPVPVLKATPLVAPAPAAVAGPAGSGGGACKAPRDCGQDTAQCLAQKAIGRGDAQNASSYFVQYDSAGKPSVVRYLGDIASEREEADAADCSVEMQACLASACAR
jgi:hypothetical protein